MIPLQIGNWQVAEERRQRTKKVRPYVLPRHVEDQVVTRQRKRGIFGSAENPVGMLPIEIAVRVDHLRLDP